MPDEIEGPTNDGLPGVPATIALAELLEGDGLVSRLTRLWSTKDSVQGVEEAVADSVELVSRSLS